MNDSVLGSISISDESVDDSPEWRHDSSMINKLLSSWHKSSTKTKQKQQQKQQQQNNESSKDSIGSTTSNSIDSTTVTTTGATSQLRIKERLSELWNSSFNQSSVDNAVYESSVCSATTTTEQHIGVVKGCTDNDAINNQQQTCGHGIVKKTSAGNRMNKQLSSVQSRMESLVNTYHESCWKKRLVVSSTIVLFVIIVVLVIVGQSSKSSNAPMSGSNTGEDGSDVVSNIRKRPPKNETNGVNSLITESPSIVPTSLQGIANSGGVEACIDNEGRYYSSSGKKRQCAWLAMTSTTTTTTTTNTEGTIGPLYSDLLYTECARMTELGLNCRYTCRAYNGCLILLQNVEQGVEGGSDKEEVSSPIPTLQMNATMELLRVNDNIQGNDNSDELSTSVQSSSQQHDTITRLSMDNVNDYTKSLHVWQEELGLINPTSKLSMEVQQQNEDKLNMTGGNKTEMTLLSSPLILTAPATCIDNNGYYLNHNGLPRQCSWLINSHDPTDETRRIHNCGYNIGSSTNQYSVSTELGKMCKETCGTC